MSPSKIGLMSMQMGAKPSTASGPIDILNVRRLPARVTAEETAKLLGLKPEHIPILMRDGLLVALGDPAQNAPKFFSSAYVVKFGDDPSLMSQAHDVLSKYWQNKNKKSHPTVPPDEDVRTA